MSLFHRTAAQLRRLLTPAPAARRRPAPAKLRVEGMEDRLVQNAVVIGGDLVVYGTNGSDSITVSDDYSGNYTVRVNNRTTSVAKSRVWNNTVRVFANAGDDYVNMASWVPLRMDVYGGSGNDTIWGGRQSDVLRGETGNDTIHGGDGHDYIDGGFGNDTLHGQNGNDTLVGQDGNDTFYGGSGRDHLSGGFGADVFYDYDGGDSVVDTTRNNQLYRHGAWWNDRSGAWRRG